MCALPLSIKHQLSFAEVVKFPSNKCLGVNGECNAKQCHDHKLHSETSVHAYLDVVQPLFKEG